MVVVGTSYSTVRLVGPPRRVGRTETKLWAHVLEKWGVLRFALLAGATHFRVAVAHEESMERPGPLFLVDARGVPFPDGVQDVLLALVPRCSSKCLRKPESACFAANACAGA